MKFSQTIIGLAALTLAACGGGSTPPSPFSGNNGYFRVVNGSADTGAVDVYIDGTKVNTTTALAYGQMTQYVKFAPGSHQIVVDRAGTQTAVTGFPAASLAPSLNGGQYVSLVISGEFHPVTATDTPNILFFNDSVFSTPAGGAAASFHNAAGGYAAQPVPFGYYYINTPSTSAQLGTSQNAGGVTQPQGLPSSALNASTQVGFYATSPSSITVTPNQLSSNCTANTLPCDTGNFTLYLIDGPADSTMPSAGPYPNSITATSTAGFVGILDANGT